MRLCSNLILILLFLAIPCSAQEKSATHTSVTQKIPNVVKIRLTLLNSPGVNHAASRWEIAYELRMANEQTFYEGNRQGKFKAGSPERVGDLIAKGSFSRTSLRHLKNRKIAWQVPLPGAIKARLRGQPRERIELTAANATPENIKLSREQERKAQVFFFYSTANFYDGKLRKNVIFPIDRIWLFHRYPDADFKIDLEVTENGYKVDSR